MCARRVYILPSYFFSLLREREREITICIYLKIAILNVTFISSLCLIIFGFFFFVKKDQLFAHSLHHSSRCLWFYFLLLLLLRLLLLLFDMAFDISNWPLYNTTVTSMCVWVFVFSAFCYLFRIYYHWRFNLCVCCFVACTLSFPCTRPPQQCRFCSHQTITQCASGFPERFCDIIIIIITITPSPYKPIQRNGISVALHSIFSVFVWPLCTVRSHKI